MDAKWWLGTLAKNIKLLLQKKSWSCFIYGISTIYSTTTTTIAVNPIPYRADYFGHKLHIDQNEKLVMYEVTRVAAIDGHSRFVVAGTTMPVKNNLTIYREIYKYGFYLLSFVKCTSRYFWISYPSFDALLSCFSGQFFQNISNAFFLIAPAFYH